MFKNVQTQFLIVLLGCILSFASCKRMERVLTPVMPEPEPTEVVEPPEMVETVEPPVEMMPVNEGIGIFETNVMPGHGLLTEAYYPGVKLSQIPDFETLTPFRTFLVANIDVPARNYTEGFPALGVDVLEDFAIRLRGKLKIETAGTYNFTLSSDDGSKLYIDGNLVIDHDGLHGMSNKSGSVTLSAGLHPVEVQYFQGPRVTIGLQWFWQPPDGTEEIVPPEVLYPPDTPVMETPVMEEAPIMSADPELHLTVGKIYWTQTNGVLRRANPDGSNLEDVVTELGYASGLAVDRTAGKVYWVDHALNGIQRANLDGSNIENLVSAPDTQSPADLALALDVNGGKMYWTGHAMTSVRRANLDGSNVEDFITGLTNPNSVILDVPRGKIYWTSGNSVHRANLDLSDTEEILTDFAYHMAIHAEQEQVYWTRGGQVRRANLDGSGEEILITGLGQLGGIELDTLGGKMYWRDWSTDKIQRANIDGSNLEDVVTGVHNPDFISFLYDYQ